ncbi:MAG: nucleoside phosphorylase [Erysipelotrichaceae bacterium]|nr:nucleoside phosphorylase [Erysipelotrichaceae bacterium]
MSLDKDGVMYHTHLKKGDVGRYVILPGDPFRTDFIAEKLDNPKLIAHNRELKTFTGYLNGEMVSVTSTGMGGASAAIAIEELIKCGADTFIRVGTAGLVSQDAQERHPEQIIVTAAVRDEGTTKHYIPIEYPAIATRSVVEALNEATIKLGIDYMEGIIQCKDSYFGQVEPETMPAEDWLDNRWLAWQRGNVLCTDMETAITFIIAQIRKCRAGSIMNFGTMDNTINTAVEAIRILIEKDKGE